MQNRIRSPQPSALTLAHQVISEFIATRNLDPSAPTDAEIFTMMWKLAGVTGLPPHRARALITAALKEFNESNSNRVTAISP